MKFAILKNETNAISENWAEACIKNKKEFSIIDLTSENWLDLVFEEDYKFLACPSGLQSIYKNLYDERIYIINKVLGKFVYPSFNEIVLHENKKYLAYWLKANRLPHPSTHIFYQNNEALQFVLKAELPIVAKMNIGASGKGVEIFRERKDLVEYLAKVFSYGIKQKWGPNLKMGGLIRRFRRVLQNPEVIQERLSVYKNDFNEIQRGFAILQEYIPHDFEWRIVKIGDSFFGHQKIKLGDKASGSKGIEYVSPPDKLLRLVSEICKKFDFNSMAFDVFEKDGEFLINEMQCIFGHVQDFICAENGVPGRYVQNENDFLFEKGNFNANLSYDLRFSNVLEMLTKE